MQEGGDYIKTQEWNTPRPYDVAAVKQYYAGV
jgi:hypothetical protein